MIRNYIEKDFNTLIALYKNRSAYGGNYDSERDEEVKLQKTSDEGNLLVCEVDGQLVGSVMVLDNPHTFWLLRFVVDPQSDYRVDATRELDEAVQKVAHERGHKSIIVYTNPDDVELCERYRQLGYTESSNYRCFWKGVEV